MMSMPRKLPACLKKTANTIIFLCGLTKYEMFFFWTLNGKGTIALVDLLCCGCLIFKIRNIECP